MTDEIVEQLFKIESKVTSIGTDNERGSGLGLILCKDFVEKNGGLLQIKSKKDKGTTAIISLPTYTGQLNTPVSDHLVG